MKLDKCMWNKKYKGYGFKLICNELKVAFVRGVPNQG